MEGVFNQLIGRHEALRTAFVIRDGEPVQLIEEDVSFTLEKSSMEAGIVEAQLEAFVKPFDLAAAPLLRARLTETRPDTHVLMVDMHHIISDGVSHDIFSREFDAIYHGQKLADVGLQYKDYSHWQYQRILSGEMERQEAFWLQEFKTVPPALPLPTDFPRPAVRDFSGLHYGFQFDASDTAQLRRLAGDEGITLFMLLLGGFNLLLSRLCDCDDIVVGTPIAGRRHADLQDTMGIFINTLALRNTIPTHSPVREFLAQLKARTLNVFENQDYPFEDLVEQVVKQRDTSRNPLTDVLFALQNMDLDASEINDVAGSGNGQSEADSLVVKPYSFENRTAKFDLGFLGVEVEDRVAFTIEYGSRLFKPGSIERFARYYRFLLMEMCREPEQLAGTVEWVPVEERRRLLEMLDNRDVAFPEAETLISLFEKQVERTPVNIALHGLEEGGEKLDYSELNIRVGSLARLLQAKGITEDSIVGICLEPGTGMVVAALATLKAGGAYMPIDPVYPPDRIAFMLHDSSADVLVTCRSLAPLFSFNSDGETVYIDDSIDDLPPSNDADENSVNRERVICPAGPSSMAYIIYTSGSTGKPKGVPVTHRCGVRLFVNKQFQFDFGPDDVWTLFHSFSFDFSVWEMYGSLLFGGKCLILPRAITRDTGRFLKLLAEEGVTVLNQTPSAFYALMAAEKDNSPGGLVLRYVIFGGEALNPAKLKPWKETYPETKLINMYGITETTVHVTYKEMLLEDMEQEASNIGKPIPTLGLIVLDSRLRPLPTGVPGELCVTGDGLARGYLNRPTLTSEKFTYLYEDSGLTNGTATPNELNQPCRAIGGPGGASPWRSPRRGPRRGFGGTRLYRSGDLGRILENGDVEHLGRIDQQVKIRGFRIELGEIETRLLAYPGIKEAVVVAREDEQRGKYLVAALVAEASEGEAASLDTSGLRRFLAETLPDYMIPAHFVTMGRIPLTPHGKVDVKALPEPMRARPQMETQYEAPESRLENTIAAIWADVLGLETGDVGMEDNFFDLGGNSLDIVKVSNRVKEQLSVEVPVISLFEYPTVRSLAQHIHGESGLSEEIETIGNAIGEKNILEHRPIEIAVIGMAGRFPGARNIDEFWQNLVNGVDSITFYSDDELREAGVPSQMIDNPNYVKSNGGLLEDKEYFDATFFDYTPQQAELMNPQMRIFHQCAWEALEHAGYIPDECVEPVGLFAGASTSFHWEILSLLSGKSDMMGAFGSFILANKDHFVTNVAYKLNLRGPAVVVQTACSTSLVAIDAAVGSLMDRRCRMALAGGVTVSINPSRGYLYQEGMVQSPDGLCRAFDAQAQGLSGGEGVGVVLLKHLDDARADGDTIHAVIKGSATNNDGRRKVGYAAPSIQGQSEVIRAAIDMAGVPAETITYVEAHGTGTVLGDPVEIQGLTKAFNSNKKGFCRIGSVKTNIGHLDAAAGVAGVIKTVLALKNKQIPPSLHYQSPNPAINFEATPFIVNSELTSWESDGHPLRAGVSSFGIGGTNAHILLEEFPQAMEAGTTANQTESREYQLLLLSARTATALDKGAENMAQFLKENPGLSLADAAYTMQVGRKGMLHRRLVVCSDSAEAVEALTSGSGRTNKLRNLEAPSTVFMFAGLGGQYVNMGRDLYRNEPLFRKEMDQCFEIIENLVKEDIKIKETLFPEADPVAPPGDETGQSDLLLDSRFAQPVVFALEYALARLLMAWGIRPRAVIGYSFGEYVAAAVARVFSLEDALRLVTVRSRLIHNLPEGAMMSVPLPKEELMSLLEGLAGISLAVDNGESCLVSGEPEVVDRFEAKLKERRAMCLRIPAKRAIHSPMMEPVLEAFGEELSKITLNKPAIPWISNVTGDWVTPEQAVDPGYWVRHLRQTVLFDDGIQKLTAEEGTVFIEIGPGREISALVTRYIKDQPGSRLRIINPIRHPRERVPDHSYLLNRLGQYWLNGGVIDWAAFYENEKRSRVPLPTYPFEGKRFWSQVDALESGQLDTGMLMSAAGSGFVDKSQRDMEEWFYAPVWEQADLSAVAGTPTGGPETWLIFLDGYGIGEALAQRLRGRGHTVATVEIGEGGPFSSPREQHFILSLNTPGSFGQLFRQLRQSQLVPRQILYLWSLYPRANDGDVSGSRMMELFKDAQETGLYALLDLTQATGREDITSEIQLTAVTSNVYDVTGDEALSPERVTVPAALKSIQLEYPNIHCHSVDVVLPTEEEGKRQRLIEQLDNELVHLPALKKEVMAAGFPDVEAVAYRGVRRWRQVFSSRKFLPSAPAELPLKERGVYLITGGFGGMGFTLAQYLAENYRARLVLVSRSGLPPREEWPNILAENSDSEKVHRIQTIGKMESFGADVLVAAADISDMERMKDLVAEVRERFGSVNGVLHTAAVIDYGGIIQRRDREQTEAVFAPKVNGLLNLEALLDIDKLDFMTVFSSIAAVFTTFGQVGYVAANSFLDAYTSARARETGKYSVINWSDWLDVGMAVRSIRNANEGNPERAAQELKGLEPIALSPAEGTDAFLRILANGLPRVMVLIQPVPVMARFHFRAVTGGVDGSTVDMEDAVREITLHPRPQLSTEYSEPESQLEKDVARVLQQYLAMEQVGLDDNFFELGLSSLDIIQVNGYLKEVLGREIPLVTMFTYPTIGDFCRHLGGGAEEAADATERVDAVEKAEEEEQAGDLLMDSLALLDDEEDDDWDE